MALFTILDLNKIISAFKDARRYEVILAAIFVFQHIFEEMG